MQRIPSLREPAESRDECEVKRGIASGVWYSPDDLRALIRVGSDQKTTESRLNIGYFPCEELEAFLWIDFSDFASLLIRLEIGH